MSPEFPPLMTGHELKPGQSPARKAAAGAAKGKYGAGDLLWVRDKNTLDYAIVLEPEVDRTKALEMVFTQMVALGDAIGALAPPEVAITHYWPNQLLANGGLIGEVTAILSPGDDANGHPDHMVIATHIAVRPNAEDLNPGLNANQTTLWDEGCGDLDAMALLDSAARHFMTWVHNWEEDGFQDVLTNLDGRMERSHALAFNGENGTYLGMDERANLLMRRTEASGTMQVAVGDALATAIEAHVA